MLSPNPDPISIAPTSEIARLLDKVRRWPLVLKKSGIRYRLVREDAPWVGYDAKKVKTAIRKTAGSWAGVDTNATMTALYRARAEGSRPARRA